MADTAGSTYLEPLATAQQLADYSRGTITATDPRVGPLLDAVSRTIRRLCGWHIAPVIEETLTLDGPGGHLLELPTMRLLGVISLTERRPTPYRPGTTAWQWDADALADLEWSPLGTIRRRSGVWTDMYRGIEVRVRHGYETAPDVAQVVCQVAAMTLASPTGAITEQAGGVSMHWGTTASGVAGGMSILDRDLATIEPYRIRRP